MTINLDSQVLESYVPVYDAIPEEWEEAKPFIVEQFKRLANAVNVREIGYFLDEELLSGKAFIPGQNIVLDGGTTQQFRTILRKVVDFGALPNAGLKQVRHEINIDANFTLILLYAAATDPVAFNSINIPYASPVLNENIKIFLDATFINIQTAFNFSSFTRCFVIIEYIQEL